MVLEKSHLEGQALQMILSKLRPALRFENDVIHKNMETIRFSLNINREFEINLNASQKKMWEFSFVTLFPT